MPDPNEPEFCPDCRRRIRKPLEIQNPILRGIIFPFKCLWIGLFYGIWWSLIGPFVVLFALFAGKPEVDRCLRCNMPFTARYEKYD